ncbi:thiamine pyrophosphate-binding protein [Candidatus Skiveiella danica]|uniref:thiamine pyrophosphate-binding protein n=1 Tax=Candidatus Skiveiella danica TaxID=3386177 RepID=UPI0039B8FC7D
MPNGAQALMKTLVDAGIDVCFTNPGTSEMHFVAALDSEPKMRAVLALFEGVATGAADGYARMADKPAATLLHLGCGLGNGLANLHNARKGKVPVVNIVGDHATYHTRFDAQLQSDIETVARNVSPGFVRTSQSTAALSRDAADAIVAPAQVATRSCRPSVLGQGGVPAVVPPSRPVTALRRAGLRSATLLGGRALREPSLLAAAQIAAHSGVKLLAETFPTRLGAGCVSALPRPSWALRTLTTCPGRCQGPVSFLPIPTRRAPGPTPRPPPRQPALARPGADGAVPAWPGRRPRSP